MEKKPAGGTTMEIYWRQLWPPLQCLLSVSLLWWTLIEEKGFGSFLCFALILVMGLYNACVALAYFKAHESRRALPAVIAFTVILAGTYSAHVMYPVYLERQQDKFFAVHLEDFQALVGRWQKRSDASVITHLIVAQRDHPMIDNEADLIVYDDSDGIARNPDSFSGLWPREFHGRFVETAVGGSKILVRSLGQHYYYVTEVDP